MTVTTYTVASTGALNWDAASTWNPNVVPNSADADVTIQARLPTSALTINPGESFTIHTLDQETTYTELVIDGSLAIDGTIGRVATDLAYAIQLDGGTLSAPALTTSNLTGYGSLTVAGNLTNNSTITGTAQPSGSGSVASTLSLTFGSLTNTGSIIAQGPNVTVVLAQTGHVSIPGFPNLTYQGTVTGGTLVAEAGGVLDINLGGNITNDDGAVQLIGPSSTVASYDTASGTYLPLQATLQTISSPGILDNLPNLTISDQTFIAANAISISGTLALTDGAVFEDPSGLDLSDNHSTGIIMGSDSVVSGPIQNGSFIIASPAAGATSSTLVLAGPVTGGGQLQVGSFAGDANAPTTETLELGAGSDNTVAFQEGTGILQLDDPAAFTGYIAPTTPEYTTATGTAPGDQIVLAGIALSSVTSETYTAATGSGTLTIAEGATQQTLTFLGSFDVGSFALSTGPTLASGQPSLEISIQPLTNLTFTLGVANSRSTKVLTDGATVSGTIQAGTAVALNFDGVAVSPTYTSVPGADSGSYTASLPSLTPGLHQVTAVASNGASSATAPLSLYELPSPVAGITTPDFSSFDIHPLLGQGYSYSFLGGTQEMQLTNGIVSVGPDTNAAYVQRLYEGLLLRPADPLAMSAATAALASGVSPVTIAAGIISSPEYAALPIYPENPGFIYTLYQNMLGRAPSGAETSAWNTQLLAGTSRAYVAATAAISDEARIHLASTTTDIWLPDTNGTLITDLYQAGLGRDPELPAVTAWQQQLTAGLTPLQLAQAITGSAEFATDHAGQDATAYVTNLYASALGRTPGASELLGWVGQLNHGATSASVLLGIATSVEATTRLSPAV